MNDLEMWLQQNDVKRLTVADRSNQVVLDEQRGDLPWEGLYDRLFGDMERIARLRAATEGRILPQSWAQGEIEAFVTITEEEKYLIGIFTVPGPGDVVAMYRAGKKLTEEAVQLVKKQLGG